MGVSFFLADYGTAPELTGIGAERKFRQLRTGKGNFKKLENIIAHQCRLGFEPWQNRG
jgi:hypothetical protein